MAFEPQKVYQTLATAPIVPVFYHADADLTCQIIKACYEGGIRAFEFTNRGDKAKEVFKDLINIKYLDLSSNRISFINSILLSGIIKMERKLALNLLKIHLNQLRDLLEPVLKSEHLSLIDEVKLKACWVRSGQMDELLLKLIRAEQTQDECVI